MIRSRRTHALALAMLAALFMFGGRARAVEDPDFRVLFGPVGIAPGERALVNIYAIGNPNEIGNPNDIPWTFLVRVFRSAPHARSGAAAAAWALESSAQSRLPFRMRKISSSAIPWSRRTFRAEIVGFNPQPDPPGKWAVTLEVVDRLTGRTKLFIGNPDVLPAKPRRPCAFMGEEASDDSAFFAS